VGRVSLWGTVIEHEKGYRAENARILAFDDIVSWSSFNTQKALALVIHEILRRRLARYRPPQ
jgi:hypothetical protein